MLWDCWIDLIFSVQQKTWGKFQREGELRSGFWRIDEDIDILGDEKDLLKTSGRANIRKEWYVPKPSNRPVWWGHNIRGRLGK